MGDEKLPRPATYADLEAVPPHRVAEIIRGTLHTFPRPAPKHARASSALGGKLFDPFDAGNGGPGGWILLDEPELHFDPAEREEVLVPDLAGWRRERLPRLPEEAFFRLAPDWICEVLSPSTVAHDRVEKMPVYAREGMRHAWLVDPIGRSRCSRSTPTASGTSPQSTATRPASAPSPSRRSSWISPCSGVIRERASPALRDPGAPLQAHPSAAPTRSERRSRHTQAPLPRDLSAAPAGPERCSRRTRALLPPDPSATPPEPERRSRRTRAPLPPDPNAAPPDPSATRGRSERPATRSERRSRPSERRSPRPGAPPLEPRRWRWGEGVSERGRAWGWPHRLVWVVS